MAIFQDSDFVGKQFSISQDSPAYFSTLAKRSYFVAKKGQDLGKIRAIVTSKSGQKFFNVISPNYPGKQLYFKYKVANFTDLVAQGVRTTKDKARDDQEEKDSENQTFFEKIQKPLLVGGLLLAGVKLGSTYISAKHGK